MSGIPLAAYAEELTYAAGPGAAHIASSVTAAGNVEAKVGIAPAMPGPALRSALARVQGASTRTTDTASADQAPRIANRMAKDALRQGARLLSGDQ